MIKHGSGRAIIIDQDSDQALKLKTAIEGLFINVQIFSHDSKSLQDGKTKTPDILFLSLALNQRESSFTFLEQTVLNLDPRPATFGYLDLATPELIAHALECGIYDVFSRPFDPEIIASKINHFLESETSIEKNLNFVRLKQTLKGELELNFKLLEVDESGFTMQGEHYLSKGASFMMSAPLSQEIFGVTSMPMMVTKTWLGENMNDYIFFAEPKAPSEITSAALRRFILNKTI